MRIDDLKSVIGELVCIVDDSRIKDFKRLDNAAAEILDCLDELKKYRKQHPRKESGNMDKYQIGDLVITTKDTDIEGTKVFPIGTIGRICDIEVGEQMPYVIEAGGTSWIYSEDMFNPYNSVKDYDKGANDAWELAKKVTVPAFDGGIGAKECIAIFGENITATEIMKKYSVKEVLAKFKVYQKDSIKIGDIVKWHPFKDYEHIVLSNEFEGKVIIKGINTDYTGHAPIDELECTGKTGQIKIEINTEENNG